MLPLRILQNKSHSRTLACSLFLSWLWSAADTPCFPWPYNSVHVQDTCVYTFIITHVHGRLHKQIICIYIYIPRCQCAWHIHTIVFACVYTSIYVCICTYLSVTIYLQLYSISNPLMYIDMIQSVKKKYIYIYINICTHIHRNICTTAISQALKFAAQAPLHAE